MLGVLLGSAPFIAVRDSGDAVTLSETPEPTPDATPTPTPVPTPVPTPTPTPDSAQQAVPPVTAPPEASGEEDLPKGPVFESGSGETLEYSWGDSVPESASVENEWFADAAFIGNSLNDGLMIYGSIREATYISAKSINVANIYTEKSVNAGGGNYITIPEKLAQEQYAKIFIMLGINEVFRPADWFYEHYAALIDHIRDIQPDAEIFIQSILPVTPKKSASPGGYNKTNVLSLNEQLVLLAEEKCVYYLDVHSALTDLDGYLPEEASTDGVHLKRDYYQIWCDYLKCHTITEVSHET